MSNELSKFEKLAKRANLKFDSATKSHTKAGRTKLNIMIRWSKAGKNLPDEFINEDKAADALVKFISCLVRVYGTEIMSSIAQIPNGACGLVSRHPSANFRNPANGQLYGYKEIDSTGWSVKTHSSTAQKADQIAQIKTALGMERHSVEVDVVASN